jgi:hypothetical protein
MGEVRPNWHGNREIEKDRSCPRLLRTVIIIPLSLGIGIEDLSVKFKVLAKMEESRAGHWHGPAYGSESCTLTVGLA